MSKYIDTETLKAEIESIGLFPQISADYNDGREHMKMMVLDIIDSLQQEQPEATCKTCGFYENDCPFTRGKLMVYPNKVCKDYTCSAMKEQSHFADADKMDINIPERIFLWEDEMKEFLSGKRKTVQIGINQDLVRGLLTYVRYDVAQEVVQPEVDLEKEFNDFLDNIEGVPRMWHSDEQIEWAKDIARHFYELGLNTKKIK
jgi:hypothetical protein